ncbi:MAG: putative glycosidase [Ilumatobacteraceae bacterium]|nr:putative glycosidase [Ilumatobacteraceae bacterium]
MIDDRATRSAPARPAAVLWDMDGTLVDTEPYWIASEYALVAEHGGTWSDEHARAIVGFDLRDAAAYIREHGNVDMPIDDIVNTLLDDVILRVRDKVPWRPGARELLRELRHNGVPCALVTMSWRRFAEAVVDALPDGSFDLLVTGDEVTNGKPHPEPYTSAASSLGFAAKDCIALEDSPTGVRSAVAAGCTVYAIPNVVDIPPGPGYTLIESLRDLDLATLGAAAASATRTRRTLAIAAVVTLVLVAIIAVLATRSDKIAAPPPPDIPIDAWAPYWALDIANPSASAHGTWLRDVSPFWFTAQGATQIVTAANLDGSAGDKLISTAKSKGARVVPSIFDGMPPGGMAAVLADPVQRAAHVQAIVSFVADGHYDGVDIDYESFAFSDGRSTWDATRASWVAFITELGAPLHAAGKTLTVSVPPILDTGRNGDSGYWVYDYAAIGPVVDHIRIMAYDYSTSEPGPVAPLDYVRRAIAAAKDAVHDDSKLVLGVGLHGYNWPLTTDGTCPAGTATGRTAVSEASIDELLAKRQATAVHDAVTGEASFTYQATFQDATTSCTQTREVHYIDAEGARERVDLARTARLGGVALWALGYDSPQTWAQIGSLAAPANGATTTSVSGSTPATGSGSGSVIGSGSTGSGPTGSTAGTASTQGGAASTVGGSSTPGRETSAPDTSVVTSNVVAGTAVGTPVAE